MGIEANASITIESLLDLKVIRSKYPEVPKGFAVNPNVIATWKRYAGYLDGKEPLLGMAYFVLSYLEKCCSGRKRVSSLYKIDYKILDTLGMITSTKGDQLTARKGRKNGFDPLSKEEEKWVEECVKLIIKRLGEHEGNPNSLKFITMDYLPKLQ